MAAAPHSGFILVAKETADGILFTVWGWDDLLIEDESQRSAPEQIVGMEIPPSPIGLFQSLTASLPKPTIHKTQHVTTRAVASTRFTQLINQLFAEVPAS